MLLARHAAHPAFGWKDPRNALTIGFWRSVAPALRVVVCVRDPLAATRSLQARTGCSDALGVSLWWAHYTRLLADVPADARVVTHYDAWFHDPEGELRRVCAALGLTPDAAALSAALATVRPALRHHRTPAAQVLEHVRPPEIADVYMRLCAEAGGVYQRVLAEDCVGPGAEPAALPGTAGAWLAGVLRARVARLEDDARAHAAALTVLHDERDRAAATLAARARELASTRADLETTRAALHDYATTLAQRERELAGVQAENRDLAWRLGAIVTSRTWRLAEAWWRLRRGAAAGTRPRR